jgi:hypothetical protein
MNLVDICEAIAERLRDVDGLRPEAYQLDSPPAGNGDVIMVTPGPTLVEFQRAMSGGLAYVNLSLLVFIQMTDTRSAFLRLNDLMSSGTGETRSVIDALMLGDRTFGGVCGDIVVDDVSNVRAEIVADGARYLTAEFNVRVFVGRL